MHTAHRLTSNGGVGTHTVRCAIDAHAQARRQLVLTRLSACAVHAAVDHVRARCMWDQQAACAFLCHTKKGKPAGTHSMHGWSFGSRSEEHRSTMMRCHQRHGSMRYAAVAAGDCSSVDACSLSGDADAVRAEKRAGVAVACWLDRGRHRGCHLVSWQINGCICRLIVMQLTRLISPGMLRAGVSADVDIIACDRARLQLRLSCISVALAHKCPLNAGEVTVRG